MMLLAGLAAFVIALQSAAAASEISVTAEVVPERVEIGDTFVYQVTVKGNRASVPNPTVNLPAAFQILTGPNSNVNMRWVNGRMSSTRTLTYTLRALRDGNHVIPAPTVKSGRTVEKGNAVTIVVLGSGRDDASEGERTTPGTGQRTRRPAAPPTTDGAPPDVFMLADVQPGSVYLQQPVEVTYTLYFRIPVRTFDIRRLSTTEGFWTEEVPMPNRPAVFEKRISGETYSASVIHRLILFPTRTGELTVGPMEIACEVQLASRRSRNILDGFFDDPFFGGNYTTTSISSKSVEVQVKQLPARGQPSDFRNIVGNYSVKAELDCTEVETNESVTLTVTVEGVGNIGFVPEPDIIFPPDIEPYNPQIEEAHEPVNGNVRGSKKFTYLLIPRRSGRQRIAPVRLSYFNPESKKYVTRATGEMFLEVRPASGWTAVDTMMPRGSSTEVLTVGTDIRWILDSTRGLSNMRVPLRENPLYWLAYIIPLAIAGGAITLRRRINRLADDRSGRMARKAARRALAAIKQARAYHLSGNAQEGFTALARGLVQYFSDRTGITAAELGIATMRNELESREVDGRLIKLFESIFNQCQSARFTPRGANPEMLAALIERGRRWILTVDRYFDRRKLAA